MPLKVGLLGIAHVHAPSYVHACRQLADFQGHWDKGGRDFDGSERWDERDALISACDALIIAGENLDHAELIEACAKAGKPVLCEKPLAASAEQADRIQKAINASGTLLMTAFPCPFAPAFESAMAKIEGGDIGQVLSVCATNHGKNPGGWFNEPEKSGGGAIIDHVVHVADLLRRILGEDPESVQAYTGSNMYNGGFEDTAMLTISFPSGVFATLDASWSRPTSYKTWGDVTLKIVGEKGIIELDLFLQAADWFDNQSGGHRLLGFASDLDSAMVAEFLAAVKEGRQPKTTMEDGLAASRVALAAYESAKIGQPVKLGDIVAV
jgi:predicted dehydrogenase